MKKSILMLAIASGTMFFMPSCKKAETLLTPTENATVGAGETYTYVLPTNTDDSFAITTQPMHGKISLLGIDSDGKLIYTYISDSTYNGTDKVIISTIEGAHVGPPRPPRPPRDSTMRDSTMRDSIPVGRPPRRGKCNKNEALENDYIITINFNVIPK